MMTKNCLQIRKITSMDHKTLIYISGEAFTHTYKLLFTVQDI